MEYCKKVNSEKRKTHWAFTIEADDFPLVKTTPRSGVERILANTRIRMYVGPIENGDDTDPYPHMHCMFSVLRQEGTTTRNCRRSKAFEIIAALLN